MSEIKILDKYPGTIGVALSPNQVNQLADMKAKIMEGFKALEASLLQSSAAQSIPKEAYKEMASLAKLTGTTLTIHGPVDIDLSGMFIPEQEVKHRLKFILDKAKEMAKILKKEIKELGLPAQKRVPVTVHSSIVLQSPLRQWDKEFERKIEENLRRELMQRYRDPRRVEEEIQKLKEEKPWIFAKRDLLVFLPENKPLEYVEAREIRTPFGKKVVTVEEEAKKYNQQIWQNVLGGSMRTIDQALQLLTETAKYAGEALYDPNKIGLFFNSIQAAELGLNRVEDMLNDILTWIEKYGKPEHKRLLNNLEAKKRQLEELKRKIEELKRQTQNWLNRAIENPIKNYEDHAKYIFHKLLALQYQRTKLLREIENEIGKNIARYGYPEIVKVGSEYYIEKASENLAKFLYEFLKEKVKSKQDLQYLPTLTVENILPEYYASRGSELAKLIEKTRKKLYEMLSKDEGFVKKIGGTNELKNLVKEIIGATWDVGHIYSLRSKGYTKEDIIKETEKVAKYVKHIHLTDNYGDADTHLPPGQGEVPIKEMLEKIRELAEEKGLFMISEIGGWYQYWGAEGKAFGYTLEGLSGEVSTELYPEGISFQDIYWAYAMGGTGIEPVTYAAIPSVVPYTVVPGATVSPYNPQQPLPSLPYSALPFELGGIGPRRTFSGLPAE